MHVLIQLPQTKKPELPTGPTVCISHLTLDPPLAAAFTATVCCNRCYNKAVIAVTVVPCTHAIKHTTAHAAITSTQRSAMHIIRTQTNAHKHYIIHRLLAK